MITLGTHWYSDTDGSRYTDFAVSLPYTIDINGTVDGWLIDTGDGHLRGVPPTPDSYTYIITVTADNGETDIVMGYMDTRFAGEYEYTFTFVVVLIFWGLMTLINLLGYFKEIPLLQIISTLLMTLAIIPALDVTSFRPMLLLFVLLNIIMFILGMLKYRRNGRDY